SEFEVVTGIFGKKRAIIDERIAFFVLKANIPEHHHIEHWNKQLMLVENVQFVQGPQGIIPSLVGLYDIKEQVPDNSNARIVGQTLLFQSCIYSTFKFFHGIADWNPCSMVSKAGNGIEGTVIENIKRAFKIMQSISDDKRSADHV